jgi:hypothetical protein
MKRFLLALLAAIAALGRTTLVAVLESGRWVWRVARAVANVPEPDVAAAIAEADAVEPPAPALVPLTEAERMGRQVICHLAPFGGEEPADLPEYVAAYLDRLTPTQRIDLASLKPGRVGAFVLGTEAPPSGLLPVPSEAEYELAKNNLACARQEAIETAEANRLFALSVIEDLIADCDRPRKAA